MTRDQIKFNLVKHDMRSRFIRTRDRASQEAFDNFFDEKFDIMDIILENQDDHAEIGRLLSNRVNDYVEAAIEEDDLRNDETLEDEKELNRLLHDRTEAVAANKAA